MRRLGLPAAACLLLSVSVLSTIVLIICSSDLRSDDGSAANPYEQRSRIRSGFKLIRNVYNQTRIALACRDTESECAEWAAAGECEKNAPFMNASCQRSCSLCPTVLGGQGSQTPRMEAQQRRCEDKSSFCGQWAAVGECDSNPGYMRVNCPVTCHLCQSARCHDVDVKQCAAQARAGACRAEPDRMYKECRWSCKWCAMETGSRCRRAAGDMPAARQGTLEYMFGRAVEDPSFRTLTPRVHSRDPWVVSFETFLSHEESERIIQVGGRGWQRSQAGDGVQAVRTSSTAWCDPGSCQRDPVLTRIRRRISNLTLVPERNAEHMQVLKYDTGQFYRTHHDQNSPLTSAWGPRMYTVRRRSYLAPEQGAHLLSHLLSHGPDSPLLPRPCCPLAQFFMYLNDGEAGGETHFPRLNISVKPKRGRAVLWPSVLDRDPTERDDRTEHEAVTVYKGVKYAANYWLHMYDFQYANDRGCGNTEVFGNW